jgi:hypothetical protein
MRLVAKILLCTVTFLVAFYSVTIIISACCSLDAAVFGF